MAVTYTTPSLSGVGTYEYNAYDVWDTNAPTVSDDGGGLSQGESCLNGLPTRLSGASTDLDVTGYLDVNNCAINEGIENDINTSACDVSGDCGAVSNGCSLEAGCEVLLVEFIGENMDAGDYDFEFDLIGPGESTPRFDHGIISLTLPANGFGSAFAFVGVDDVPTNSENEVLDEGTYTYQCEVSRDGMSLGTPKVEIDVVRTPATIWYPVI